MKKGLLRIGTAGWNLPSNIREDFPKGKSHLADYSQLFNAVEINTSFYKFHQKTTYERWAAATSSDFKFSVKMSKEITHNKRLVDTEAYLDRFINEVSGLKNKLGPLLIQLPASLSFEVKIANSFFALLRKKFKGKVVLEPRHISWAQIDAEAILAVHNIERVFADPVKVPKELNSKQHFSYYRLHGTPKIYSSSYNAKFLDQLAKQLNNSSWVIFDNTKLGAATQNALDLKRLKQT